MTWNACGATPCDTQSQPPSPRRPNAFRSAARWLGDALVSALLAPCCVACKQVLVAPLDGPVCAPCWATLRRPEPPTCTSCGASLAPAGIADARERTRCRGCDHANAVDVWSVTAELDDALRDIVHAFKYEGRRSLARPLGRWMAEAAAPVLGGADCVVPVPLHPWKRLTRGFNQARDLARQLGPPVVPALWRTRLRSAQVGLPALERQRNVQGVFAPSQVLGRRVSDRYIHGRVVALVDDVRTTGATLNECALVLKRMGAAEIRAVALAQAPLGSAGASRLRTLTALR